MQLEAKSAAEALLRRQLGEMGAWLRALPPRVGTALSKAGSGGGGGGGGGRAPALPDGATRSAVVGAISQQVEAQLAAMEKQRAEREAKHSAVVAAAANSARQELEANEAEMAAQRQM